MNLVLTLHSKKELDFMLIKDLFISQESIRNTSQIPDMVDYIKNGGIMNTLSLSNYANLYNLKISPLINIIKFPDNKFMIHDGHHRCVAIYLAGREFLYPDEYIITEFEYEDYTTICFENGWLTPFDPLNEVREAEFYSFKEKVNKLYLVSEALALDYIAKNKDLYCHKRRFFSVKDLSVMVEYRIFLNK
jgi:hypothetical protein